MSHILDSLSHSILITTLRDTYSYFHFTDKESKTWKVQYHAQVHREVAEAMTVRL